MRQLLLIGLAAAACLLALPASAYARDVGALRHEGRRQLHELRLRPRIRRA